MENKSFEQTKDRLRGMRWTPEEAKELHDFIDIGTIPHKKLSIEYLEFEHKHLSKLVLLWRETGNEELRQIILRAREALECVFDGGVQVST